MVKNIFNFFFHPVIGFDEIYAMTLSIFSQVVLFMRYLSFKLPIFFEACALFKRLFRYFLGHLGTFWIFLAFYEASVCQTSLLF